MSRVIQYEVVTAGDAQALAAAVAERLAASWQPCGGITSHAGKLLQAVVLTAAAEKRIRKNSED